MITTQILASFAPTNAEALNLVRHVLSSKEWSSGACSHIERIIIATGQDLDEVSNNAKSYLEQVDTMDNGSLLPDSDAMECINVILSEREWDADASEQVAQILRSTGRKIAGLDEEEQKARETALYAQAVDASRLEDILEILED